MPAIYTPEMMAAGFVIEPLSTSGDSEPAQRPSVEPEPEPVEYVARLNGSTQYYTLTSPISVLAGDTIEIEFVGGTDLNQYARFFAETTNAFTIDAGIDKTKFRIQNNTATLDGLPVSTNDTIPTTGNHKITSVVSAGGQIDTLGSLNSGRLMSLPLYNFKHSRSGTVLHEISLMDKPSGANQQASTGSVNAVMVDYDESVWEQLTT